MIHGAVIGGVDTLDEWGLMLLADVSIGTPPLKQVLIDVPGRDGSVNMSYALGGAVYGDRQITFSLFKACDDQELNTIRNSLAVLCHGLEKTLVLPDDPSHEYTGLFNVGGITGYNSGTIQVSVIAHPWAYKVSATEEEYTIPAERTLSVTLENENKPVPVDMELSDSVQIDYNGTTYSLTSAADELPFLLPSGGATFLVTADEGTTLSFSYREARL